MILSELLIYGIVVIIWNILIWLNYYKSMDHKVLLLLYKKCYSYLLISSVIIALLFFAPYLIVLIPICGFWEIMSLLYKQKCFNTFGLISIILYLLFCCLFISHLQFDILVLIRIYLLVNVFDANSQLFGMLIGRTKVLPKISPSKTIEGTICGLLSVVIMCMLFTQMSYQSLLFSLGIALFSFIGDMLASLYKRKVGVKDFSNYIPYHGGILDRFDSYIGAGVFSYVYMILL